MALPRTHQASFTPGEIEFIAGDEKIMIIPKAKMPKMKFIKARRKINTRHITNLTLVYKHRETLDLFSHLCPLRSLFGCPY